jgi:exonuclease VII large subunit
MSDIKSAREIAMEKVAELGEISAEERLRWKFVPEGERLAAKYLRKEYNLVTELAKYEAKAAAYVREGATEILVRNVDLPRDEAARKNNRRAMDGLKLLKQDKAAVENIYSRLRRIFEHYLSQGEQQRKQAYESFKAEYGAKTRQAMQQQFGATPLGFKIDVERLPQFQNEWRQVLASLESQYYRLLDEYKRELVSSK